MSKESIIKNITMITEQAYAEAYKAGWNACRNEISHTAERVIYYTKDGKEIKTYKYTIPERK